MPPKNIGIDVNLPVQPQEPTWKWLVKHLVVPILTAIIGAAGAGWAVHIQALHDRAKGKAESLVEEAALDHIQDEATAATTESRTAVIHAEPPPGLIDDIREKLPELNEADAAQAMGRWREVVEQRAPRLPNLPSAQLTIREKR